MRKDPKQAKQMLGINLLKAIELANLVRSVGDFDKIDDLVPGYVGEAAECVLAASFNCNCYVSGPTEYIYDLMEQDHTLRDKIEAQGQWFVHFLEEKYANALAGELNEQVFVQPETLYNKKQFSVLLPKDVGRIATIFDDGELDEYVIGFGYNEET